jgi:hypothetical protein
MVKLTYPEFHDHVRSLAQKLRQQSFIPKYILADKQGLIAASFLASRFQWYPIILDARNLSSRGIEGKVLVFSFCSDDAEQALLSAAYVVFQEASTTIATAAVIEVGMKVDFSATDSPEEIGPPWA